MFWTTETTKFVWGSEDPSFSGKNIVNSPACKTFYGFFSSLKMNVSLHVSRHVIDSGSTNVFIKLFNKINIDFGISVDRWEHS